ncbi:hypothetical protein G4228_010932 [Cervus hanglu yarkandensis]|nr:hypothetical protein G4228_010932 [Cervus hanglu yarkandensis]
MKMGEDVRGAHSEGPQKLVLCVLCGLPAAGKSTFALALRHRLRQELGWAVGVVAYDDVMPEASLEASARPLETDRLICSTNILHQADQTLRRIVSQTMKEAKDEQMFPYNLKLLAEELNKLKAECLEDLRQGNKRYLCFQQTTDLSDVISFFHYEKDNIVQKYFSKQH